MLDLSETYRKHVMAIHTVVGVEGNYNIRGVWMWKGVK